MIKKSSSTKTELFGTKEATKLFIDFMLAETSILKGIVHKGFSNKRLSQIKVVIASIVNNSTAIAMLSEKSLLNESTMLARSFLERLINCCYLMVCSEEEYQKYFFYSSQKSYRKLDRKITIDDKTVSMRFAGKVNLDANPELKAALEEFTGVKGGEKTRWTNTSIEDRVALVSQKTKINASLLMLSLLSVYEDASEALHGTFYGATFHIGHHLPEFKRNDLDGNIRREQKNISLLCVNCGSLIDELIQVIGGLEDIQDFVKKSKHNTKTAVKLMDAVMKK